MEIKPHQHALTEAEFFEFFEKGWIVKRSLFGADEIDRIRDCFDALETQAENLSGTRDFRGARFVLDRRDDQTVIRRVVWAGGNQKYLLQIGADDRLTIPCAILLRSSAMDHLLSQAHFKRPGDGVIFGWHQDIQHRDKGAGTWEDVNGLGSYVQTLLVVDPMTSDNGPLLFIPGSSRWGPVDFGQHDYDDQDYLHKIPPEFNEAEIVTITAKPGDTLFFGPYTAHASFANNSPNYRRVLINGYAHPGANHRVYPGEGSGRRLRVAYEI